MVLWIYLGLLATKHNYRVLDASEWNALETGLSAAAYSSRLDWSVSLLS
jgi:hypothetical protein